MEHIKDLRWKPGMSSADLVEQYKTTGFQSIELGKAADILYKIWSQKAKLVLSFTSNLATSGLRGFFAQLVELGLVQAIVTTAGSIEEDIMRAHGEQFRITRFNADDIELHEKGHNRIGNILITNDSYMRFEGIMQGLIDKLVADKPVMTSSEFLAKIGKTLDDKSSFLYQAAENEVPVFCPAITDGAIGFHLYMARDRHKEFSIDMIGDFGRIITELSPDDRKAVLALGGGVSKHFAILSTLISGGADYAVYMTSSSGWSGSLTGASTNEAKSWGKVKDDSDSITVIGDAAINFPLAAISALDRLKKEGKL
ncbi:MAG: deoxyhypusine synthase family protein [Candidatus Altiarchaeota archaeon]|nr:deoxyhypusine synthase family protein [Candidatus Altiarchaeota archaeon]